MKGSYRRQIDKYLADYFQSTWEIHVFSKYFESLLSKDLFPFRIGLSALHFLLLFTAEPVLFEKYLPHFNDMVVKTKVIVNYYP